MSDLATGPEPGRVRSTWEVGDIFQVYGRDYRQKHRLSPAQAKVMRALGACRTAALGAHLERCDHCGFERPAYNSCRNRHCPKCQGGAQAGWLTDRQAELLPVPYFHVVFTLPHELNRMVLRQRRLLLTYLFRAVAATLGEFGARHLGGPLGFIAVLHTWDQQLRPHFHLHCLVAGGVPTATGWIPARPRFLFAVRALSRVFRGKLLDMLNQAAIRGELSATDGHCLTQQLLRLRQKPWVVYAKKPFHSPATVVSYLARYTYRVAISNRRLIEVAQGQVSFRYRDRRAEGCERVMTLSAEAFIGRFLLHVLPARFTRIRSYGFLANRCRKTNLARCRQLLEQTEVTGQEPPGDSATETRLPDPLLCPNCREARLRFAGRLSVADALGWDSS